MIKQYSIKIIPDEKNGTLTIQDDGIGMDKEDLKNNLGIIARSGTQQFVQQIKSGADLTCIG